MESFHDRAPSVFFGNGCVETESPHIALATLELAVWAEEAQLERLKGRRDRQPSLSLQLSLTSGSKWEEL